MKKRTIVIISIICGLCLFVLGYWLESKGMLGFLDNLLQKNRTASELFEAIKNDYFKKISLDYRCYDFPYAFDAEKDKAIQTAYSKINLDIDKLLKQDQVARMFKNFRFKQECSDNYGIYFTMAGINGNQQRAFGMLVTASTTAGAASGKLFVATTTAVAEEVKQGGFCTVYFISSGHTEGDYVFFKCASSNETGPLQQIYGLRKTDGRFGLLKECRDKSGDCTVDKSYIKN